MRTTIFFFKVRCHRPLSPQNTQAANDWRPSTLFWAQSKVLERTNSQSNYIYN